MDSSNHQLTNTTQENMSALLKKYYHEVREELDEILNYWMQNTYDAVNGGFIGHIDNNNRPHVNSPKGAVLNARILWSFSNAYKITSNQQHLYLARIAFNYLVNSFLDKKYGGVYWTVSAEGKPLDTKKQVYALAFVIYACCAYYEITNNETAKNIAINLYRDIETHSFDKDHSGYLEAFTRDWMLLDDLRLSNKDANEKKTMNTHLHILEAYTTLYRIWPDEQLKNQLVLLIKNFATQITNPTTGHLVLFFDEQWQPKSGTVSYGHDIEAAWLLPEAARETGDQLLIETINNLSLKIATAAAEGLDEDGSLWYENDTELNHIIKEKHWWVQAEAMIGFLNAWQLSGDDAWLQKSLKTWQYVKAFIKDKNEGEWLWGRHENNGVMMGEDKVGIWKCPYHNSRACTEIIHRLEKELAKVWVPGVVMSNEM